ncbi:hypothetical protein [Nocardia transvalensis]|uniref:hypothetical protein n=1 Tax=Nocardia transvalensis TaxID=37333 RepID=UPI001895E5B6|nr:hypothetical protein [Nocardia transvalensis]MBF6331501.1 hypothetical protein [Nocardia transvalensis]
MEIPRAAADPNACRPHSRGPLLGGIATVGAGLALHNVMLGLVGAIGCALTFYGPCWTLTPRWRARRQARRWQHFIASHDILDLASPELARLADAYDELVYTATLPGVGMSAEAAGVGHLMVLECSSLLDGRTPAGPAELEYVATRATEIRSLTTVLARQHREHERLQHQRALERRRALDEIAAARTELEHETGVSAVFASRDLRKRYENSHWDTV